MLGPALVTKLRKNFATQVQLALAKISSDYKIYTCVNVGPEKADFEKLMQIYSQKNLLYMAM